MKEVADTIELLFLFVQMLVNAPFLSLHPVQLQFATSGKTSKGKSPLSIFFVRPSRAKTTAWAGRED